MSYWRLVERQSGRVVVHDLRWADGFFSRLRGLQCRPPLPAGRGLLLIPCSSVHTCFVRGALDLAMLDAEGNVVDVRREVPPWRIVVPRQPTWAVLEARGGTLILQPGDALTAETGTQAPDDWPRALEFLRAPR